MSREVFETIVPWIRLGIIIVVTLVVFAALGFIPANIAKKKGYSFGGFWAFGFFFFLPALIVSLCINDKYAPQQYIQPPVSYQSNSTADELKKYSELHEQGAITDEEFAKIKEKLLNNHI